MTIRRCIFLAILIVSSFALSNCGNDDKMIKDTLVNSNDADQIGSEINDYVYEAVSRPDEWDVLEYTLNCQTVKPFVDQLTEQGFVYSWRHSFVQTGYFKSGSAPQDSLPFRFVTLTLVNPDAFMENAAYVVHVTCELGSIVAPYLLSFGETAPDSGFVKIVEGVWQKDLDGVVVQGASRVGGAQATRLFKFLDCWRKGSAVACGGALIACGISGPAYPECAAIGCAGGAIVAGVSCAFDAF